MASLRELRTKVKSVKSTQQITKAMKLVAAARLNRAQERIMAARPFAERMEQLLGEIVYLHRRSAGPTSEIDHPFLHKRSAQRVDLVLVTADRGLCGGFNATLLRRMMQFLREHPEADIRLWCVGKKGRDFVRRFYKKVEGEYVNIFQRLTYAQADIIGEALMDAYEKNETRGIFILYNEFKSRLQQKLVLRQLLPIAEIPGVEPKLDFIYDSSPTELLDALLPRYVKAQIFRILLESQSAELAARMAAMDSATSNAKEIIANLTLTMNKVRQAGITKELAEIVGGAESLRG